jgi:hypothetical protein
MVFYGCKDGKIEGEKVIWLKDGVFLWDNENEIKYCKTDDCCICTTLGIF